MDNSLMEKLFITLDKQNLINCIDSLGYIEPEPVQSVQSRGRENSKVKNLRIFHNKVKESVFKKIVQIYPVKKDLTLLEISVGRGGDIRKWDLAGITNVFGFDIDPESIGEAKHRLYNYKVTNTLNKNNTMFSIGDATKPYITSQIENYLTGIKKDSFDFVSCQFSLHYFFKKQENLKEVMNTISNYLSPGGYFFGTVINGSKLVSYLRLLPEGVNVIDRPLYNIEFDFSRRFKTPYGKKYNFVIKDLEDKSNYFTKHGTSVEYLVLLDELNKAASETGLQPVQINFFNNAGVGNFTDFKDIYSGKGTGGKNNFPVLSTGEQEISFLNTVFVFKKI